MLESSNHFSHGRLSYSLQLYNSIIQAAFVCAECIVYLSHYIQVREFEDILSSEYLPTIPLALDLMIKTNPIYNRNVVAQQAVNIENHLAKAHSIYDNERKHQIALREVLEGNSTC